MLFPTSSLIIKTENAFDSFIGFLGLMILKASSKPIDSKLCLIWVENLNIQLKCVLESNLEQDSSEFAKNMKENPSVDNLISSTKTCDVDNKFSTFYPHRLSISQSATAKHLLGS